MLVFKSIKLYITLAMLIAITLISISIAGYIYYQNSVTPHVLLSAIYDQNLPSLELATRKIRWQVIISKKVKFPAHSYVLAKTCTLKAGFNLEKITVKDISINKINKTITLTLPPPEILSLTWGNLRVLEEKHSIARALLTKGSNQEIERNKLFNQALIKDLEREELLSFEDLTEGIYSFFNPILSRHKYKLVLKKPQMPKFHTLCQKYIQDNNI